ncbi:MAG: isocitrate lyase/phosphoenolpyruvate mutase family protein [Firmicutes bacterium]|nr:isocitrate lyase/phosphoenolpyruvate mutase family protein [Bacillota bacterium]
MISARQKEKAKIFSAMHKRKEIFILPNAWDVGSACVFQKFGFEAIATTSAGVAHSLGLPDGEQIELSDILYLTERIAKRVDVPITVDFERAFSEDIEEAKENVRRILFVGAIGINIEDGFADGTLSSVEYQVEKIKAIAQLKEELDLDFVINARTCTYLHNVADEEEMLEMAVERSNAYLAAGADCVFIPGALSHEAVVALTERINGPINLLLTKTTYDTKELGALGIRRLSVGSAMARWSYGEVIKMAEKLKDHETTEIRSTYFTLAKANEYFDKE